jgi:hypothetical protein
MKWRAARVLKKWPLTFESDYDKDDMKKGYKK